MTYLSSFFEIFFMIKTSIFGNRRSTLFFYSTILLISLYLLIQGAALAPDSGGYIHMSPGRSLLYPLFLKINQWIFGDLGYGIVAIQLILGVFSIDRFVKTLGRFFYVTPFIAGAIFFFCFVPYFIFHGIGNHILTEALCYPFFFLLLSFLLKFLKEKTMTSFVGIISLALLLTLTRSQFLFLWPALLILLFYMLYKHKETQKFFARLIVVIVVIGAGNLAERAYSYALTGSFKMVPFVGYQFIILPLHLSSPSDIDLFTDPQERAFFKDISEQIAKNDLSIGGGDGTRPLFHYEGIYNTLCYANIGPASGRHLSQDSYKQDAQLLSIGLKLARRHIIQYVQFYVRTLIYGFGEYWTSFILMIMTLCVFFKNLYRPTFEKETFLMLVTLHLGNVMLVALFEPLLTRFTIYTAIPLWSFLLILIHNAFFGTKFEKQEA